MDRRTAFKLLTASAAYLFAKSNGFDLFEAQAEPVQPEALEARLRRKEGELADLLFQKGDSSEFTLQFTKPEGVEIPNAGDERYAAYASLLCNLRERGLFFVPNGGKDWGGEGQDLDLQPLYDLGMKSVEQRFYVGVFSDNQGDKWQVTVGDNGEIKRYETPGDSFFVSKCTKPRDQQTFQDRVVFTRKTDGSLRDDSSIKAEDLNLAYEQVLDRILDSVRTDSLRFKPGRSNL